MRPTAWWAAGLWHSCCWWASAVAQRPMWYYGWLESPLGMLLEPSQHPLNWTSSALALLQYYYWVIIGILVGVTLSAAVLFVKLFRSQQQANATQTAQDGDPEEAALAEALHLLDVVLEKIWRHLRRLEKNQSGQRRRGREHRRLA